MLIAFLALATPNAARAQEQTVVTNVLTGVAIDGYDPVAYFTKGEPTRGSPQYVFEWAGVPWYFASEANRDVFARTPDIYAPLFGGHGAMAMTRGYLSDGNPQIFSIVADRLLLFFSVGNREAFTLAGHAGLAMALANWDDLPAGPGMTQAAPPAAGEQAEQ